MPRPPSPEVRARLLAAGRTLMLDTGFHGSGVKDLTDAARVPKGSFYSYFPSKDDFAVAVLEDYWRWVETTFGPHLRAEGVPAPERLARFFRAMAAENARRNYTAFCLIGNLTLELVEGSPTTRATVAAILARWEALLAACIAEGRGRGEVSTSRDPGEVAQLLVEAWEGAIMRTKVERSPAACRRFDEVTLPLLLA